MRQVPRRRRVGARTLLESGAAWPAVPLMGSSTMTSERTDVDGFPVLGGSSDLYQVIQSTAATDLIVAIQGEMTGQMFRSLLDAQEQGVEITRLPVAYEELLGRVPIHHLEADWVLRSFVDERRVNGSTWRRSAWWTSSDRSPGWGCCSSCCPGRRRRS
jgi:hypothetical protein